MDEEGLRATANELIHIGKPIEIILIKHTKQVYNDVVESSIYG